MPSYDPWDRHNFGWSRDFAPALTSRPGETIHVECLDAGNGHFGRHSTATDVATLDFTKVNPVTGPVDALAADRRLTGRSP